MKMGRNPDDRLDRNCYLINIKLTSLKREDCSIEEINDVCPYNPPICSFGQRLRANGLAPKAIVAVAIRKLLHLVYGILKSGLPFDPHYFIQASTA